MSIATDIQKLSPGDKVSLFVLDTSALGGSLYRMCSAVDDGSPVMWQGYAYAPTPVEMAGFEVSSGQALPTPTLRLSDESGIFRALARELNDLIGAKITRYVTYRKYLDGEPDADPLAHFPVDVFYVSRKTKQHGITVEWQCAALMDQQGKQLPGRTVLRDICDQRYRVWDASTSVFDYTDATCPYAGDGYFDDSGVACQAAADSCGQRLTDCILRYGAAGVLPFRGFPGVLNVRN